MLTSTDIRRALADRLNFLPVSDIDVPETKLIDLECYDFVLAKPNWGSVISCAAVSLRTEDAAIVKKRSQEFYTFSRSLRRYAGSIAMTRLGGFGLLLIISDGPTSRSFQDEVRAQKFGTAWRQDYCLVWLVDQSLKAVFVHRGFPLRMHPSQRFFQDLLKGSLAD